MTLVGFKARNHGQQIRLRGVIDAVDERWTPDEVYEPLRDEFAFDLDVASTHENAKCEQHFTLDEDALLRDWGGYSVWCNPPFSDCGGWVAKAWQEWERARARAIVMLLPANRTEQRWWQDMVEPYRDRSPEFATQFLPSRINFGTPTRPDGRYKTSAPFGCVLLIWKRAAA